VSRVAIAAAVVRLIAGYLCDPHAAEAYSRITKIAGAHNQIGNLDRRVLVIGRPQRDRLTVVVMIGPVTSSTVTEKLQFVELPAASVAVAFTIVVPSGKTDLIALLVTTVGTPQLSLAVTVKLTASEHEPDGALTVMLAGRKCPAPACR